MDNGGRFFNLFAHAKDEKVDFSELARVAGVYASFSEAFLFFELSVARLPPKAKDRLVARFSRFLKAMYRANRPRSLRPSRIELDGKAGDAVIVTGCPRRMEDREELASMMMIPISAGDFSSFMMVPVFDRFDAYEVFDTEESTPPRTLIATSRGSKHLDSRPTTLAGYLKRMQFDDPTGSQHGIFLETLYYTRVDD
jgi:hypothetical protein